MKPTVTTAGVLALALALAMPCRAEEKAAAAAPEPLTKEQLDQLVAPIALYPDPLLSQVLFASTYPLEIVEADRWRRKQADLKGDALDKALEQQDWDPSVEGLTHFPDLLKRMSENLDWTKDVGDAFLAQQADLMDAVQRMRRQAEDAGTLKTTKEQTVVVEKETVRIEPADPQVVYVPTYPPTVYGPTYAPPPSYYPGVWGYPAGGMLMSFGMGMATGALIGGAFDWDDHDCYHNDYHGGGGGKGDTNTNININKERNVDRGDRERNVERGDRDGRGGDRQGGGGRQKWQHNPEHRRNVGYGDQRTAQKFEGGDKVAARQRQDRDAARGFDRGGEGSRPGVAAGGRAGTAAGGRAETAAGGRPKAAAGGRPASAGGSRPGGAQRPASSKQASGGRQGAFEGYGNAGATRQASARGAGSRSGHSYAGRSSGGGGGRGGGGHGGGRGGGGRGGGGGGGGGRRR